MDITAASEAAGSGSIPDGRTTFPPPMSDSAALSVLQWNIGNFDVGLRLPGRGYRGMAYTNATPSRDEDLADFSSVIRALGPDFVTLQEVVVRKDHHRRLAALAGYELAAFGTADYRHTQTLLLKKGV